MVERARQPPTPHDVSHRNIHQREQYDYRRNKSNAQRFLRGVVRFFGGSGSRGFAVRARRAVTCLLHSRDNRFLGSRTLNAHVARQKIDGARRNAAQLFHGFFHSRRASRAAHSISRSTTVASSSAVSVLPRRKSSATQVRMCLEISSRLTALSAAATAETCVITSVQ